MTWHRWELPLPASVVAVDCIRQLHLLQSRRIHRHLTHKLLYDGYTYQVQTRLRPLSTLQCFRMLWRISLAGGSHWSVTLRRRCCLTRLSSLEVRFSDHPVDFIDALSKGGYNRILVDLVDFASRLLSRLLGRLGACLGRLHPGWILACQYDLTG